MGLKKVEDDSLVSRIKDLGPEATLGACPWLAVRTRLATSLEAGELEWGTVVGRRAGSIQPLCLPRPGSRTPAGERTSRIDENLLDTRSFRVISK